MKVKQQIRQLQQSISEFEAALVELQTPVDFTPQGNGPLDFLRAELATRQDEAEKTQLIADAQQSLKVSRSQLEQLEQQQVQLEQQADAAFEEAAAIASDRNRLVWQLIQNIEALTPMTVKANQAAGEADRPLSCQRQTDLRQESLLPICIVSNGSIFERLCPMFEARKILSSMFDEKVAA